MELEFKDRRVTAKGTVYWEYIGNSRTYKKDRIDERAKEIKSLVGQRVSINGKESVVLQAQVSGRCNLMDTNYYAEVLTNEEFIIDYNV